MSITFGSFKEKFSMAVFERDHPEICYAKRDKASETSKRFRELEVFFPSKCYWGESAWNHFIGCNLDTEIVQPAPISERVVQLSKEPYCRDDKRVILIPKGLSLEKLQQIVKRKNIPLTIDIHPDVDKTVETQEAAIYVVKTKTDNQFMTREGFDFLEFNFRGEGFNVLTLVTLCVISFGKTDNGRDLPRLFTDTTICCKESVSWICPLTVTTTDDRIVIAPCRSLDDRNLVSGTCIKAS